MKTTTSLCCNNYDSPSLPLYSDWTSLLQHIMFTTLPRIAQQLQVASNYLDWRQVEETTVEEVQLPGWQLLAGSYYRSTLDSYYNMTSTTEKEVVVDVEKEQITTGASTIVTPTTSTTSRPVGGLARRQGLPHRQLDQGTQELRPTNYHQRQRRPTT